MLVSEEKRGDKLSDNSNNNFPFIKLPRALVDDPNFSGLSAEAKLLFSLILDRMGVSQINADRFTDKNGNLFVYYTIQEICLKIGCSHGKAVRLVNELEYHGLIFKQRKGCGKPNKIIVLSSVLRILKTVHNFYAHVDKSSKISIADTLDKLNAGQEAKEDKMLEIVSEEKTLSETKKDPVKGSEKGFKKAKISTKVVPIKNKA